MPEIASLTRPLAATDLSQYIRLENCERYLRFRLFPEDVERLKECYQVTEQPLTPLLQAKGSEFEEILEAQVRLRYFLRSLAGMDDPKATVAALKETREEVTVLSQAPVRGEIHGWPCAGIADLVWVLRTRSGRLRLAIADIKASRKDRVEHRLQVAFYARLLRQMAEEAGEAIEYLHGAVIRVPESGGLPDVDNLREYAFDLEPYLLAIDHLLGPDGVVARVASEPFDAARYHLSYKCDGCLYNSLCIVESSDHADLALIGELSPVARRLLQAEGIETLDDLAGLKVIPERGARLPLSPAPGREATITRLSTQWQIGPKIDFLVQRAQALRARRSSWLLGGGHGHLPAGDNLVKVFLDAQYDYLEDRVYLIGALICGPGGEQEIVRMTAGPPDEAAEEALLLETTVALLDGLLAVAGNTSARVHFYLYDRYDQKVLLDALRRHLPALGGLTALFDLLTEHEALSQPMVSFLADEVRERRNLPATCTSLYAVAGNSWVGPKGARRRFDWNAGWNFRSLFRARIFDNRRRMVQTAQGLRPAEKGNDDTPAVWIESASRFNSQLPLEYAYGAWGQLPDPNERWRRAGPGERALLKIFQAVTPEQIKAFQAHRVRALAHIEASFEYKNNSIGKRPLELHRLALHTTQAVPLRVALEEFVFLEHHASLQEKLLHFALPPEQRAASGRSLLVVCLEDRGDSALFQIDFGAAGLDPVIAQHAFRLKEGDWVVLNPADRQAGPWEIVKGRLAVIAEIADDKILLFWRHLGASGQKFRYFHRRDRPIPGVTYVLDEMADDVNADKHVAACRAADSNVFYRWIEERQLAPRHIPAEVRRHALTFVREVQRLEAPRAPTSRQAEIIGQHLDAPIILVQGPPGTGKSDTIGWAVLARLAAWMAHGHPMRVAVVCRTHTAVNIVLERIAKKWRRYRRAAESAKIEVNPLAGLEIFKLDSRENETIPDGVTPLDTYNSRAILETILGRSPIVIGATPGGLYNLMKRRPAGDREILWDEKTFDLVVMDEASQMTVPEAVLATAWLRADGQVLVVGDPRQMPPILAHTWDEEARRHLAAAQPYKSTFEFLRDLGAPVIALDESFRLHRTQAEFLADHIYRQDGIPFYSRQTHTLPPIQPPDPYTCAVLRSDAPIVVVEHDESGSQQYNPTEIELISPLIAGCLAGLGLEGGEGLGVVVPHRAQKAALRKRFPTLAQADAIDTVERFQGAERDVIIVSATASDPDFVLAEASFLLNPNRLNVALSRPRKKLVVVASRTLFRLLCADLDVFEHATLWKRLRYEFAGDLLWRGRRNGTGVEVFGRVVRG